MSSLRQVMDRLLEILSTAQAKRSDFAGTEWIDYERSVMRDAVNAERGRRGLGQADLGDLARVERLAEGHVDYSRKFALGCAELALGLEARP